MKFYVLVLIRKIARFSENRQQQQQQQNERIRISYQFRPATKWVRRKVVEWKCLKSVYRCSDNEFGWCIFNFSAASLKLIEWHILGESISYGLIYTWCGRCMVLSSITYYLRTQLNSTQLSTIRLLSGFIYIVTTFNLCFVSSSFEPMLFSPNILSVFHSHFFSSHSFIFSCHFNFNSTARPHVFVWFGMYYVLFTTIKRWKWHEIYSVLLLDALFSPLFSVFGFRWEQFNW